MAFLGAAAIPSLVGLAVDGIRAVINKYIPDPAKQSEMELEVFKTLQASDLAQMAVNAEEAKNPSVFVSGWRPAIGWVGAFALFYIYIGYPFLLFVVGMFSPSTVTSLLNVLPKIDNSIIEIVIAMLGLGGLRTFEKVKGIVK